MILVSTQGAFSARVKGDIAGLVCLDGEEQGEDL